MKADSNMRKLQYLNDIDKKTFLDNLPESDPFIVELCGRTIDSLGDYLDVISEKFRFPIPAKGLDGYNDWMCDLSWIEERTIVIVINDYELFLQDDIISKQKILDIFCDTVIPWWEHDVLECVVDVPRRPFYVICVIDSF